ncbi:hypothetical protein [Streptomyces sp. NPDC001020]
MEGREGARREVSGAHVRERGRHGQAVYDRGWAKETHGSIRYALALFAMLQLIDWGSGAESPWRATLWFAVSMLLFAVLCPRRVCAGEGWLASRGLLRTRRVRTDLLVSVRCVDGVSQRLVLRDVFSGRVEIDPRVLVDNPDLWHRLDEDARKSMAVGSLLCGQTELDRVRERIDRETALTVFRVSGLE